MRGLQFQLEERIGALSSVPDELERLARLVRIKNDADAAIGEHIGRPSVPGNIGEYAAAEVFAIQLMTSRSHPGHDGVLTAGPVAGKTVNIKTYGRHESVLDISRHPCDYCLVLAGPAGRARVLPWVIDPVFLFEREHLAATPMARGVKICAATSVRQADRETARVFPPQQAPPLQLAESQLASRALFSPMQAT